MSNLIAIIIIIIGAVIMVAFLRFVLSLCSINYVRCPKCDEEMEYMGNDDDLGKVNGLPKQLKHHYYKCPHCGEIKII